MSMSLKTLMFTDQSRSTIETRRRTPGEIRTVSKDQEELTSAVVTQCHGRIVGSRGDGAFIEFTSCIDAVRCGAILQRRTQARNEAQTNERMRFELHVGIDVGEVEALPNGELQGNAANRAARVCTECPPGEVYFTQKVRDELHPAEVEVDRVGGVALRGIAGRVMLYRLVRWVAPLEITHNPFVWRSGITDGAAFFNRRRELRMLEDFLLSRQNVQVVGPRRIGKTSLLRQVERLAASWDTAVEVAYMDLQSPQCYTLTGWLRLVSRRFRWPTPAADLAEFSERVEQMIEDNRRPALFLDEFGELSQRPHEFTRDFFLTLRSCGQFGMPIVTAAPRPLHELTEARPLDTSPFYNTFPLIRLGIFSASEASEFVTQHRSGVPPFTREERKVVLEMAGNHPLALQVLCFHVLTAKENGESLALAVRRAEEEMKAHLPNW